MRIKGGWEPGTVVLTNRGEFRIAGVDDRTMDGRLRRLYFLARHQDLEVFRRTVDYEFDGAARDSVHECLVSSTMKSSCPPAMRSVSVPVKRPTRRVKFAEQSTS